MAILFSGIVMSHYTHHNLSPVTQILMQQTLRTVAFLCGEFCPCAPRAGLPAARQPHPVVPGRTGSTAPQSQTCTPLSFVYYSGLQIP